ncbi:unnamed protein product [Phytophthora fragariaefolia]|uniref:Unnamed protein product n=1 Tax=Phytophthora fragariaefolia TaxID=1490495 RepID=A0A9W7CX84_9STRA|nr:unnamed protein product [Phytophthora fragariaefolia]
MKPAGDSKEESHQRRRRRSGQSVSESPAGNIGDHAQLDRGSSAHSEVFTPSEQQQQHSPLASLSLDLNHATASPTPVEAATSPHVSTDVRRHTGKRRASGEMIHGEEESKVVQPTTPRAGNEIRRPDLPEQAVASPTERPDTAVATPGQALQAAHGNEPLKPAVTEMHTTALPLRVSTRRTTTTMRWSPSMVGGRESSRSGASAGLVVTPPARPISNATRNITFDMLQPHFERPLQQAADSFGVCTTLLKKICRRNGIGNWPYRKICGLRKSIASMAKQVNYFDGEQKRAYAEQLEKLEQELQAYLRTGSEPTEEFLRTLRADGANATSDDRSARADVDTAGVDNEEEEEKEALEVPAWTTTGRPSITQQQYSNTNVVQSPPGMPVQKTSPTRPTTAETWGNMHYHPRGPPLQAPVFPTIATHHQALPSIASILQHQSYSSPSRAASTQNPRTTLISTQCEEGNSSKRSGDTFLQKTVMPYDGTMYM